MVGAIVNPDGKKAPEGGVAAYAATANDTNGVVGIGVTGADTNVQITFTQPAYGDLAAQVVGQPVIYLDL